jgi:hypothetical protein
VAGWLAFALIRLAFWAHGQISLFIGVGVGYANGAQLAPGIYQVPLAGYDGQFYYRLALNPVDWARSAYGITMDQPYRYTRIGYPLLTWLLSFGQHAWVPVVLVVVNLLAVYAMGVLGATFALDAGRNALWGLLFVAYFGMVVSVGRDTAEPLAIACMLGGMLCYRRGRYVAAAALIAYGVITRETILLLPAAIALTRFWGFLRARETTVWRGWRFWRGWRGRKIRFWGFWRGRKNRLSRADLAWVVPAVAYLALEITQRSVAGGGGPGATTDVTRNSTAPFAGLGYGLYDDFRLLSWTHMGLADYNLLEFATLATVAVMAMLVLRKTTAPAHERVAFILFVLVEAVMASSLIWNSWFGELRNLIEVYVFSIVMLLGTPQVFMSKRRLGWIAAIVIPALVVVARRRVLFQ